MKAHQAQLEADNAANPDPVKMIARLDAGFGTDPNVTWLIEMGYIVYTKAFSTQVAAKLKTQVNPETRWTRVGKNAEIVGYGKGAMGMRERLCAMEGVTVTDEGTEKCGIVTFNAAQMSPATIKQRPGETRINVST